MSDAPEQTNHDTTSTRPDEEPLARLVSESELERHETERENLREIVDDLEAENRMLRQEIEALERRLEQKDEKRRQLIENYERVIAAKHREYERALDRENRDERDRRTLPTVLLGSPGE